MSAFNLIKPQCRIVLHVCGQTVKKLLFHIYVWVNSALLGTYTNLTNFEVISLNPQTATYKIICICTAIVVFNENI